MKRWCAWAAGLALLVTSATGVTAAPVDVVPRAEWLAFGIGTGHRSDNDEDLIFQQPSFLLSFNMQRGRHVGSLRHARVGMADARGDIGLLYERAVPWRGALIIGGLGPAVRYWTHVRHYLIACDGGCGGEAGLDGDGGFGGLGLAWSLELAGRRGQGANMGLAAFGDAGGDETFWGVAAVFGFGEFE